MNLIKNPELLDHLASSYALGTLRGGARRRFEALARDQAPARAAALIWQSRMASMTELQAPAHSDPAVWARVECLLRRERERQRQRGVLSLTYSHDISLSELALQLQLPLGTVKTWIRHGLEQQRI